MKVVKCVLLCMIYQECKKAFEKSVVVGVGVYVHYYCLLILQNPRVITSFCL